MRDLNKILKEFLMGKFKNFDIWYLNYQSVNNFYIDLDWRWGQFYWNGSKNREVRKIQKKMRNQLWQADVSLVFPSNLFRFFTYLAGKVGSSFYQLSYKLMLLNNPFYFSRV